MARLRRLVSLAASLLLSLAALAALSPARADFGTPVALSGGAASGHQVAVDANGNAVAVWYRSDGTNYRIEARALSAAGALGPVQTLSKAGQDAFDPQVAVDASGNAVVVWRRSDGTTDRVQARTRSAAGALGPVQTLSKAGQDAFLPQVAVDGGGHAVVVWYRPDGTNSRIQARTRSVAGALGPVQTLSKAGQNAADPQVAVDGGGHAVVVWYRSDGTADRIQARTRSAAGVLGPVQTLSKAGQDASGPKVAVDGDGNAVVVWQRPDGTSAGRIQARGLSAAGELLPVQNLSKAGQSAGLPQIAVGGAPGKALVVWQSFDGTEVRIRARARSAWGALGPVETLSKAGQDARLPQVAVDAGGHAVVVWQRSDGTTVRIQARTRSAAGALGPVQTLSGGFYDALAPQVAVSADGKAMAVWRQRGRIDAAAGP